MSPAASAIVAILRRCKGAPLAVTAAEIAAQLRPLKISADARRVREIIAEEIEAIAAALCPGVLVCQAPQGFWLAGNAEELVQREELLWKLERHAKAKRRQFIAQVKAAGFEGILPTRRAA